jgi:spore germination protein YaaH
MKRFFRLIIFLLIISQAVTIGFLYQKYRSTSDRIEKFEIDKFEKLNYVKDITYDPNSSDISQIRNIQKQPKDLNELVIGGWIPDWDFNDGFTSLQNNEGTFESISPFWYTANEDGTLTPAAKANDSAFMNYVRANNIELTPTITSFDADRISKVLNNPDAMQVHVDQILKATLDNDYEGIDLDYESFYVKDKEKYFEFLQKLSIKFIENNKRLIVTLHPKWGEKDMVYITFPETKRVMDYKRIADLVDEVRIMTYEFSGRDNIYYGPNMPLTWQEDIIRYAILVGIPREKIVLGVATYSYDYPLKEKMPAIDYYPIFINLFDPANAGLAYYNTSVDYIKNNFAYTEEFDNEWGEMVLRYTNKDNQERVIVYPTTESLNLRKKLSADYGIKGVYYWRMGDEGSLSY